VDYPAGTANGKGDTTHFVVVGALLTEDQRTLLETRVDDLMRSVFPDREPRSIEMHAVSLVGHHPEHPWDSIQGRARRDALSAFRDILQDVGPVFYGDVLNKVGYWNHFERITPERPAPHALGYLLRRIDGDLGPQRERATLTIDNDSYEMKQSYRAKIKRVRTIGDKLTPVTHNVSYYAAIHDPQFLDSKAVRGLQAADYVAYWTYRAAEHIKSDRLRELDNLWARREPKVWYSPAAKAEIIGKRPRTFGRDRNVRKEGQRRSAPSHLGQD
jgi:hypothetical protein